jgi:tyrosine-specific transport protein
MRTFMNGRFIGAVFLILGTCIGGSMLALPMATAQEGIVRTLVIMLVAWFMMTAGAFALLRVNLKLPENSNLISMAQATLGRVGAVITWLTTLILLYTLLSAYISSGEDLLATLFEQIHITTPMWLNAVLFTAILGFVIFQGISLVDYVNRGLMGSKLLICSILIILLIPFSHLKNLSFQHISGTSSAMTCITAFGYACIIPSIRSYLNSNKQKLYWAILLGSLIPLVFYLAWILVVQATIPTASGLAIMNATSAHPLKAMLEALIYHANNAGINILTSIFTSICVLTSFLGVALSLSDFLSDGMKIKKQHPTGGLLIASLTLIPPLGVVLISPTIFLKALNYAGILCVLLLFVIPLLMAASLLFQKYKSATLQEENARIGE